MANKLLIISSPVSFDSKKWISVDHSLPDDYLNPYDGREVLTYSPDYGGTYYLAVWMPSVHEWHHQEGEAHPTHWLPITPPSAK